MNRFISLLLAGMLLLESFGAGVLPVFAAGSSPQTKPVACEYSPLYAAQKQKLQSQVQLVKTPGSRDATAAYDIAHRNVYDSLAHFSSSCLQMLRDDRLGDDAKIVVQDLQHELGSAEHLGVLENERAANRLVGRIQQLLTMALSLFTKSAVELQKQKLWAEEKEKAEQEHGQFFEKFMADSALYKIAYDGAVIESQAQKKANPKFKEDIPARTAELLHEKVSSLEESATYEQHRREALGIVVSLRHVLRASYRRSSALALVRSWSARDYAQILTDAGLTYTPQVEALLTGRPFMRNVQHWLTAAKAGDEDGMRDAEASFFFDIGREVDKQYTSDEQSEYRFLGLADYAIVIYDRVFSEYDKTPTAKRVAELLYRHRYQDAAFANITNITAAGLTGGMVVTAFMWLSVPAFIGGALFATADTLAETNTWLKYHGGKTAQVAYYALPIIAQPLDLLVDNFAKTVPMAAGALRDSLARTLIGILERDVVATTDLATLELTEAIRPLSSAEILAVSPSADSAVAQRVIAAEALVEEMPAELDYAEIKVGETTLRVKKELLQMSTLVDNRPITREVVKRLSKLNDLVHSVSSYFGDAISMTNGLGSSLRSEAGFGDFDAAAPIFFTGDKEVAMTRAVRVVQETAQQLSHLDWVDSVQIYFGKSDLPVSIQYLTDDVVKTALEARGGSGLRYSAVTVIDGKPVELNLHADLMYRETPHARIRYFGDNTGKTFLGGHMYNFLSLASDEELQLLDKARRDIVGSISSAEYRDQTAQAMLAEAKQLVRNGNIIKAAKRAYLASQLTHSVALEGQALALLQSDINAVYGMEQSLAAVEKYVATKGTKFAPTMLSLEIGAPLELQNITALGLYQNPELLSAAAEAIKVAKYTEARGLLQQWVSVNGREFGGDLLKALDRASAPVIN